MSAITAFTGAPPAEIVYIPEGSHRIFPTVNGKPDSITVRLHPESGPSIAAALDSQLQSLRASNVRPFLDFDHKRQAASGIPTSFRYEPGQGIMLSVEWTALGRAAIEGRSHSYFSPEFLIGEDGSPADLPLRGPIGGLVNNPAFREIPRLAASHSGKPPGEILMEAAERLVLAGETDNIGEGLSRVCAANPELYADYCRSLDEREAVRVQAATAPESNAEALQRIEAKAGELVAAGRASTHGQAIVMACEAHPELYAAYFETLAKQ